MSIYIELPKSIEDKLRNEIGDLASIGKEAMLIELYRQASISHYELSQALGISRFEADAVLKKHGVIEDLLTADEYASELEGLKRLVNG